jgi:serine protease Do
LMVVVGVMASAAVWAQARVPAAPRAPMMMLEGPGSGIGATVRDLRPEEVTSAKLAQPGGALIEDVREGSAAARAGLQKGDIVVDFDGERVRGARHFTRLVRETPPGRGVTTSVLRAGSRRDISITPDAEDRFAFTMPDFGPALERKLRDLPRNFTFDLEMPRDWDPGVPGQGGRRVARGRLGVTLAPLSNQLAEFFGVREGVLVSSVDTDSAAARAGVRAGDVITAVNGRDVRDAGDLTRAVRAAQDGTTLDVRLFRDKKQMDVKIALPAASEREQRDGILPV